MTDMIELFGSKVYPKDLQENLIIQTAKEELEGLQRVSGGNMFSMMGVPKGKQIDVKYRIAEKDMIFRFGKNNILKCIINNTDNTNIEVY